eukprot:Partr_v1_DN23375_c0_g1_i1_m18345 putative tRNA methyltransferase 10 homolog
MDTPSIIPEQQQQPPPAEDPQLIVDPPALSKNQQRKLKRQEKWESKKEHLKSTRRERRKEATIRRRARIEAGLQSPKPRVCPRQSKMRVIFDCSFDDKMQEKEIKSLSQQLCRSHGVNRVSHVNVNIVLSGLSDGDQLSKRLNEAYPGNENWNNVTSTPDSLKDMIAKESEDAVKNMVYLTGDSPNIMQEVDEDKTYIIGAIVDKNRYKSLCYDKAVELGISTAQLPISEHIQLSSRRILTVNHVFEILSAQLHLNDWKKSLEQVIPQRKIVQEDLPVEHHDVAVEDELQDIANAVEQQETPAKQQGVAQEE